jgi:hypothetical protein
MKTVTMKTLIRLFASALLLPLYGIATETNVGVVEWAVPIGGNAFRTAPAPGGNGIRRDGRLQWQDEKEVYSVFFHLDRPAALNLAINACVTQGQSTLTVRVGDQSATASIEGEEMATHRVGSFEVTKPGYVRVNVRERASSGRLTARVNELLVSSETGGLSLDFVKSNEGNMFYWGRRGPSVHLRYDVPQDRDLRYAYSEITVPGGQDPIGSYYMANGFREGYFGFQVNSATERRVLFSVWSPFKTDNPREIPKDQRVTTLGSGPGVHVGQFGNEGSGGQSYLVYPWKAGTTYRFLTEVKPDGRNGTVYTSWFGDTSKEDWQLIASFLRPMTDTSLRGFHSFLESFSPNHGYIGRSALYGNVWVADVDGTWHECTSARLSVDATGRGRHRLDYSGGTEGDAFFMRNCGFFNETGNPGETYRRESSRERRPDFDFESLPRG